MHPHDDEENRPGLYVFPGLNPHEAGEPVKHAVNPPQQPQSVQPTVAAGAMMGMAPVVIEEELREGDSGAGRTKVTMLGERLSEDDLKRIQNAETQRSEEDRQHIEDLMASEELIFKLPGFVAGPLVASVLIAVAALLGMFVLAQATSTLSALATLPAWAKYLGWLSFLLLGGALLYAVGRFALLYLRLKPNQAIGLKGLAQLSHRTRLRWLVHEKKAEAKVQLDGYLRAYPLDTAKDRRVLNSVGLPAERVQKLDVVRKELLDANRFANNDQWFHEFRTRFQVPLDEAATERITYYARRIAIMTAASPNTLIDTLLTSYCSFSMLADLCRIYNLRVSRLSTAVLLVRVFFNAYLAGQIKDFQQVAEGGIQVLVHESGLHFGSLAMDAAVGKVAGKVGARTAAGVLNYFLLRRLGTYAVGLLRPVR